MTRNEKAPGEKPATSSKTTTASAATDQAGKEPAAQASESREGKKDRSTGPVDSRAAGADSPGPALDETLVEKTREVVDRRQRLQSLIAKAEGKKKDVKEAIYRRVLDDYQKQLKAIDAEYEPLRDRLVAELRRIRDRGRRLELDHERRQEELEELRFRHEIGEFGKDQKKEAEERKLSEIGSLEKRLKEIEGTYSTARELIGKEVDRVLEEPKSAADEDRRTELLATPPTPPKPPSGAPTVKASSGGEAPTPPPPSDQDKTRIAPKPGAQKGGGGSSLAAAASGRTPSPPSAGSKTSAPAKKPDDAGQSGAAPSAGTAPLERAFLTPRKPAKGSPTVLNRGQLVIGRSAMSDIIVEGPTVSRRHAIVSFEKGSYVIEDVSSGGGIMVNGESVKKRTLRPGDVIVIGAAVLEFTC